MRHSDIQIGATIVATGGQEYRGNVYDLDASDRVCTLLDLGARQEAEPDLATRLSQIAFVSCVGPWDETGSDRDWRCSRTCCETTLKHAAGIKRANPACQVFVLSREVNAYGFCEELYTEVRELGVLFVRFDPRTKPAVETTGNGLRVLVEDMSLHETLELHPDMVVLAAAILPRADAVQTAARLDIPQVGEGFFREWESKTRPFASLEPGVFVCGLGHGPKPSRETIAQALAAANHALTLLSQDEIALTGPVAEVDRHSCMSCLTCVRTCPYGAPEMTAWAPSQERSKAYSTIDPAKCQGCGTCVAECPARAIEMKQYGDDHLIQGQILGQWLVAGA